MKKKMKKILAFLCAVVLFVTTVFTEGAMNQAQAEDTTSTGTSSIWPTPVELEGFDTVTVEDFQDSEGNVMETKTYAYDGTTPTFSLKDGSSFASKLVSMNVKFENASTDGIHARIVLGNSGDVWNGLWVYPSLDGTTLHIWEMKDGAWRHMEGDITSTNANVTSFMNTEFLLQLSLEDTDGGLVLGVYVDGALCQTYTWTDAKTSDYAGSYMNLYRETTGTAITVDTITEPTPVVLEGFDTVTLSDFQDSAGVEMESKTYAYDGTTPTFSLKDGSSFASKLVSMNVEFENASTDAIRSRIVLGNSGDVWNGLWVYSSLDGTTLHIWEMKDGAWRHMEGDITSTNANVTSFMNTKFLLQLSFEDTDGGLVLGVYVDGELCQTYTWADAKISDYAGSYMNLYRETTGTAITVGSISEDDDSQGPGTDEPGEEITPVELSGFETVTVEDFQDSTGNEMESKTYAYDSANTTSTFSLKDGTNFDKKLLSMKVKFENASTDGMHARIILGNSGDIWNGIWVHPSLDGTTLHVKEMKGGAWRHLESDITSAVADGISFMDSFLLQLSLEDTDGGLVLGVYVDGTLCQTYTWTDAKISDYAGSYMNLYREAVGTAITVNSINAVETPDDPGTYPDESYNKITFQHFAIKDGVYDSKYNEWVFKGTYKNADTLDGIVLCGTIRLTDNNATNSYSLILGNKNSEIWNGIHMWVQDGSMSVSAGGDNNIAINSSDAGLGSTFDGQDIPLMWSIDFVDDDQGGTENDIKIGLWFNGTMYGDDYSIIYNAGTAADFGNTFAVNVPGDGDTITINSADDIMNLPGEDFGKLSLPDFVHNGTTDDRMASGSFSAAVVDNTWYVAGNAKDHTTLNKKVVSFDILQNGIVNSDSYNIRIGGKDNYWYGLALDTQADGSMVFGWFGESGQYEGTWYSISKDEAAVSSFVNETFNLTVSMELVDENGNGTSDVKVRIWFNKIPYVHEGQNYFLFTDRGNELGNILAMKANNASDNGVANISIRTEKGYQSNPYYYEEIAEYRGTTKTAPEAPAGYVFSGWYTDENYTEYLEPTVTSGSAYAKFVEEDVLSAKPQVRVTNPKVDSDNDGKYDLPADSTDLRLATTVDHLNYRRISFFIQKQKDDGTYGAEFNTATTDENARLVYEKLYAIGVNEEITYKPTAFSWQSDYFKTFTLTGISPDDYDTLIKVTPYWITMDGTLVRGKVLETCVNDYINNKSQAVSVNYIGDDTMPITGYHGPYVVQDADDVMLFPESVTDDYFKMIADSGVNVTILEAMDYIAYPSLVKKALALGEKYGIAIYVEDSKLLELASADETDETKKQNIETRIAEYSVYKSFAGIHLVDEPGTNDFHSDEKLVSKYEALAGFLNELGVYTYVNMYPFDEEAASFWEDLFGTSSEDKYSEYVAEVNGTLSPVALMWDMYPFSVAEGGTELDVDTSRYFWNMAEIRRQAQASDKPFWAYVQAGANFSDTYENAYFNTKVYAPDEGQFNWNMNTSLAFGAQGIQYFTLTQPDYFAYAGTGEADGMWDFNRNGLIGAFGNQTQWYDYAQAANTHVGAIDGVLMNSYSTQIIALGDAATATSDLTNMGVTTSAVYEELKSVTDSADVLIGCFNYKGKTALYVVNYNYNAEQNDIVLTFNGTQNITKIENAVTSKETANSISLDMEAGEGILLVIE